MSLQADYYDSRSAKRWRVELLLEPPILLLHGEGLERREILSRIVVGEQLGRAPRQLRFDDGAHCDLFEQPGLAAFLQQFGHRDSLVERWQRSVGIALLSLVLLILAGLAGYRWLLPWFAQTVAEQLPESAVVAISDSTLAALDQRALKPSELAPERQQALEDRFETLIDPGSSKARVLFRLSPAFGANALTLPDGRIVLLDDLVLLADDDEQLLAVLAHEYAHAQLRHGVRQLVRSASIGVIMAWWVGDFSHVLAAAPAVLAQLHYSRELESEADAYATDLLRQKGIRSERLAEMLEKLEARARPSVGLDSASASADRLSAYLSTHPATAERLRALRESR